MGLPGLVVSTGLVGSVPVGVQIVAAFAGANNSNAAKHPWIERDPATGVQNLKIPLPAPETARQIADALSAFADSLRGRSS